jgi:molybdopterin converting factor small subunit
MKITVHYQTQIRRAIGVGSETIDLSPGCCVPELLQRLAERHGDSFRRLVLAEGKPSGSAVLLFVGDSQVSQSAQSIHLKDGDVVTLLAPMAGG